MELQINNQKKKKIRFLGDVSALLLKLKMRREEVVVKVNGKIVPDDFKIGNNDKVEVIQVVFGG
ncbi:MAG: MoaD/ThiS family protein [Candidatus Micrarchaeia archaeon]